MCTQSSDWVAKFSPYRGKRYQLHLHVAREIHRRGDIVRLAPDDLARAVGCARETASRWLWTAAKAGWLIIVDDNRKPRPGIAPYAPSAFVLVTDRDDILSRDDTTAARRAAYLARRQRYTAAARAVNSVTVSGERDQLRSAAFTQNGHAVDATAFTQNGHAVHSERSRCSPETVTSVHPKRSRFKEIDLINEKATEQGEPPETPSPATQSRAASSQGIEPPTPPTTTPDTGSLLAPLTGQPRDRDDHTTRGEVEIETGQAELRCAQETPPSPPPVPSAPPAPAQNWWMDRKANGGKRRPVDTGTDPLPGLERPETAAKRRQAGFMADEAYRPARAIVEALNAMRFACGYAEQPHKVTPGAVEDADLLLRRGAKLWADPTPIPVERILAAIEFVKNDQPSGTWPGWAKSVPSVAKLREHWDHIAGQMPKPAPKRKVDRTLRVAGFRRSRTNRVEWIQFDGGGPGSDVYLAPDEFWGYLMDGSDCANTVQDADGYAIKGPDPVLIWFEDANHPDHGSVLAATR